MKSHLKTLIACGALAATVACSKQEEPPAPPATNAARSTEPGTAAVKEVVDTAKQQAAAAATEVEAQAEAATAKVQTLLDNARKYIAEKKWSDALASLNETGGLKLTDEQQALVKSLKEQVQKALEGSKAVGDLIPK